MKAGRSGRRARSLKRGANGCAGSVRRERQLTAGTDAAQSRDDREASRRNPGALEKQGLTTAFMEGLNSLFSATKRKARGYKNPLVTS